MGGIFHTKGVKFSFRPNLAYLSANPTTWMWRIIPIGSILAVKVIEQVASKVFLRLALLDVSLLAGWILGWMMTELENLLYAMVCDPQEQSCQRVKSEIQKKNWGKLWQVLQETKFERAKMPVRNVLTAFVMTGVGLWVVTSSGSLLASGLVFGFCVRLFSEILADRDYKKWYWVFAREFGESEHKAVLLAWGAGLFWQWFSLIRG